ncbi:hypothetical protein DPMN_077434 [Dreissena polymorpha]|uniref:Uncharacterized protein n=1 Tax=Dreissena polymorpha TaxID=45954 RepID=A0A9D3YKX6_DREPO|nr:hypothetical protein DPMN_077434 [Dreissena polymorpha]
MSGLTPLAFPKIGYAARQRRFEIRVFLLLDELPTKDDEPYLPEAASFKAPETRLHPFSCRLEHGLPGLELSHTRRPGAGFWLTQAF